MNIEGAFNKSERVIGNESQIREVIKAGEGMTLYRFDGLGIIVDITGKNYKELPELIFGPYNAETGMGSLSQPEEPTEGLNMEYVKLCVGEVAKVTGIQKFWLYPFGDDSPTGNREHRSRARARLFQKAWKNIRPAENGYGYILTATTNENE